MMNTRFIKRCFNLLLGSSLITTLNVSDMFLQSAWAINRVSDSQCLARSDFFKLINNTTIAGGVCFANAGRVSVKIYNVYRVTNGNNYGSIAYTVGTNSYIDLFCSKNLNYYIPASRRANVVRSITLSAYPPAGC
ncbi:MAG: beta/gamma crystallin domain-containing protein [Nostoc sp.]